MSDTQRNTQHASRLIIMPAYNEADNLPHVIPAVFAAAPGYDLVVIDDGSRDRTPQIAADLGATVVSLPVNLGYGGAVQTGFRYAVRHGYDLAVVIDADGQHDPAGIALLAEAVASGEADVAIGSQLVTYQQGGGEVSAQRWPKLCRYLQGLRARPAWAPILAEEDAALDAAQDGGGAE